MRRFLGCFTKVSWRATPFSRGIQSPPRVSHTAQAERPAARWRLAFAAVPTENSIRNGFATFYDSCSLAVVLYVLKILALAFRDLFRSRASVEAEITLLRHQLVTLRRKSPARIRLSPFDRCFLTVLYRIQPDLLSPIHIVKPETLVVTEY